MRSMISGNSLTPPLPEYMTDTFRHVYPYKDKLILAGKLGGHINKKLGAYIGHVDQRDPTIFSTILREAGGKDVFVLYFNDHLLKNRVIGDDACPFYIFSTVLNRDIGDIKDDGDKIMVVVDCDVTGESLTKARISQNRGGLLLVHDLLEQNLVHDLLDHLEAVATEYTPYEHTS